MTGRKRRVLRALDDLTGESREPVTVSQIAERVEADRASVRSALRSLQAYEFVQRSGADRYAPTVTGREFLALDIDEGGFVVVDAPDDPDSGPDEPTSHGKD